jgi:hypothetical protein
VLTERDSDRAIDKGTDLRGRRRLGHERASHILEYGRQIDFLLIVPTYGSSRLLAARTGMFESCIVDGPHNHGRRAWALDEDCCCGFLDSCRSSCFWHLASLTRD